MKKNIPFILLIATTFFLCGCPYDSPYNLDEQPQRNIDENLLGKWSTCSQPADGNLSKKAREVIVIIEKRTDMDYDIAITGSIEKLKPLHVVTNDSIKGTAYLSNIAGREFLNAFIHGKIYIAEIVRNNDMISILPLAEYFTSKLIKNSRELRTAVEFHYKVTAMPGYDPLFCLKNLHRVD